MSNVLILLERSMCFQGQIINVVRPRQIVDISTMKLEALDHLHLSIILVGRDVYNNV